MRLHEKMETKYNVKILLMFWMVQPLIVNTLLVLKSLEPLDKPDPFPGMKLRRNSTLNDSEFSKGITFCGHFYFRRFPVAPQPLLYIGLDFQTPFISIGRGKKNENFWLWIGGIFFEIKNAQNEDNQLWITNQWQHFCLAFSSDIFHISIIKVSTFFILEYKY